MLMSGSVDLRHSPERPKKAGAQQTKGRASVRGGGCVVHSVAWYHLGNAGYSIVFPVACGRHVDHLAKRTPAPYLVTSWTCIGDGRTPRRIDVFGIVLCVMESVEVLLACRGARSSATFGSLR